ncbi:MAG TPA: CotH kinase family protein [Verrucomicrobiales bacterium]|nr:CotH kinase family protein [Verrucomicrobiales bacterium]
MNNTSPLLPILFLAACLEVPLSVQAAPVITEFVADNSLLEDEDTETPDWIEIYNDGDVPIDLEGWSLTNREDRPALWTFGPLVLQPKTYRVVFASGKDRPLTATTMETGWIHTNFKLPAEGGYLALVAPGGNNVVSAFTYPLLEKDVAFGRQDNADGYLAPPTPGAANSHTFAENPRAPDVMFSHDGGLVDGPVDLVLEAPDSPGAIIRYTLDGGEPSLFTFQYTGPIRIAGNATVRARADLPGHLPGRVSGRTYLLLDESLVQFGGTGEPFESNLPLVVLDTNGVNIDGSREFKAAYTVVIPPDPRSGRARITDTPEFQGPSAAHLRGESSAGFDQKSYALELRDETGADLNAGLLGMPRESDWILYGPWSEKTLMRNKLIFDWMRQLRGDDGTSIRSVFVELFLNQRATEKAGYTNYHGVYLLMEKIKRDSGRVPLANLNDKTTDPDMITGGYIFRRDKPDTGKNSWSTSRYAQPLQSFDPDRLNTPQLDYLKKHVNDFENALAGNGFDGPKGYARYIDPGTFIDAQWMLEIGKQVDGYVFSTYFHKDRDGRMRAGPLWDFNISLGNADYATGDDPKGWLYGNAGGRGQNWYPRLHDDAEYRLAHWDRYWHMRQRFLGNDAVTEAIDAHTAYLLDGYDQPVGNREPDTVQNAVARHFRRWPYLGIRQWPNPPAETAIRTWQAEVDYMKDWIDTRLKWLDDQSMVEGGKIHRAPVFSHYGETDAPVTLSIERFKGGLFNSGNYPDGPLYYTLDGTDPRVRGGELNPAALVYSGPLSISRAVTVVARLRNGTFWSPRTAATFFLDSEPASPANLTVTEILYHPASPNPLEVFDGFSKARFFEFIELTNIGSNSVDLTGVRFGDGIRFDWAHTDHPQRLLQPGVSIVLVANRNAFRLRHPDVPAEQILGEFGGALNDGGERVTLLDGAGRTILDFRYDDADGWPAEADGAGPSLVLVAPSTRPDLDLPESWRASSVVGGNPGVADLGGSSPSNPLDDSDSDGVANLIEWVTGSDPEDPSSVHLPEIVPADPEGSDPPRGYVQVRYRRDPAAAADYEIALQWSEDLITWHGDGPDWVRVSSTEEDGLLVETYRSQLPIQGTQARLFLRLRVAEQLSTAQ